MHHWALQPNPGSMVKLGKIRPLQQRPIFFEFPTWRPKKKSYNLPKTIGVAPNNPPNTLANARDFRVPAKGCIGKS